MSDLENDSDADGACASWRVRSSEDQGLGGPIVFELADGVGSAFATVSIPAETLNKIFKPHLSVFAELQLDGTLSLDSELFALFPLSNTTDIYELVKEGIAPEMLEDEPDMKEQLSTLRQRLTDALALVDQTLAGLDKPNA